METYKLTTEEAFHTRLALMMRCAEYRKLRDGCKHGDALYVECQTVLAACESALLALRRIGVASSGRAA